MLSFVAQNYASFVHMETDNCIILVTDFSKFSLAYFLFKESLLKLTFTTFVLGQ